tara:strand:+ start:316 stop:474 length:159 start_codon:yes stop_codon:yes gene_type:complete
MNKVSQHVVALQKKKGQQKRKAGVPARFPRYLHLIFNYTLKEKCKFKFIVKN